MPLLAGAELKNKAARCGSEIDRKGSSSSLGMTKRMIAECLSLGSARVSGVGERVLAIANFL
jgi:hypothetical protein